MAERSVSSGCRGAWLREPLLHFMVLGALTFAVHAWVVRDARQAVEVVAVTPGLKQSLAKSFEWDNRRPATEQELEAMVQDWIRDELLYRDAQRLGLIHGDQVVRQRVVERVSDVWRKAAQVGEPSEAQLRRWLARQPERYREVRLLTFEHVFADRRLGRARQRAEAFAGQLRSGAASGELGDSFGFGRELSDRPEGSVRRVFGDPFTDQLLEIESGTWHVLVSAHGAHAVRVHRVQGGQLPGFDQLRQALARDWKQARRAEALEARVAELRQKHQIVDTSADEVAEE